MATLEQRVSYIEGRLDSLATKADLAKSIGDLETRLIKWMVGVQLGGIVAMAAVVTAVVTAIRLLGLRW